MDGARDYLYRINDDAIPHAQGVFSECKGILGYFEYSGDNTKMTITYIYTTFSIYQQRE